MEIKNILPENKKGAMEMSVGTIVTIVLLMSVLVLGIFLVQNIFDTGTSAIDSVDNQVQSEINKLFSEEGKKMVVYPTSREVSIEAGDDTPKGFAFSVKNKGGQETADFSYKVRPGSLKQCEGNIDEDQVSSWMLGDEDEFSLGPGGELETPRMVRFSIPEGAPPCTFTVVLEVMKEGEPHDNAQVFITIQ